MDVIWAKRALLPAGWAQHVQVTLDDGRIRDVTVGQPPQEQSVGLLLPAPVNVHSHAFQRAMAGMTEGREPNSNDNFWTWRKLMYRFLAQLRPDHVEAITAMVQMEMLEAGYATNAEFHYLHHQPDGTPYASLAEMSDRVAAAAKQTGIGLCLLPVFYQFAGCDGAALSTGQVRFGNDFDRFSKLHEGAAEAMKHLPADTNIGVAPHSLRAVSQADLQQLEYAFPSGPIHMHAAEQLAEVEEVQHHWGARPIEWALANLNLDARWCLVHGTQMTATETARLARSGATAGLCPITESSLGDGIFNGTDWVADGGHMAIGSDSNIRISLTEELRTLEYSQRLRDKSRAAFATEDRSTGRHLFDAIVQGGARATGRRTGAIEAGQWADLLALDDASIHLENRVGDMALDSWIFAADDRLVRDVWCAGRHVVRTGRHIHHDAITETFRATLRDLADVI